MSTKIPFSRKFQKANEDAEYLADMKILGTSNRPGLSGETYKINLVTFVDNLVNKMKDEDKQPHEYIPGQCRSAVYGTIRAVLLADWERHYSYDNQRYAA